MFCLSQGHESDIIIQCLVRSNRKEQIGFLKEKSRLVVGTSRQKSGLYIIGNAKFLKENSPVLWKVGLANIHRSCLANLPINMDLSIS